MRREQLEHIIRASAELTRVRDIVVIGSQAILAVHPDAPMGMLVSIEADVFPRSHPERAGVIDGAIGEGSQFHETFGYYAHGVGPETAKAPAGWEDRLVALFGGLGVWLLAPATSLHIGASGVVFGYAGYLLSRGFLSRRLRDFALAAVIALVWGGALLGGLLPQEGISWQGHLFGGIGGLVAGRVLADRGGRQPRGP